MTVTRRTHRGPATPALGPSVTAATSAIALGGSRIIRERRRGTGLVSLVQAASTGATRAAVWLINLLTLRPVLEPFNSVGVTITAARADVRLATGETTQSSPLPFINEQTT